MSGPLLVRAHRRLRLPTRSLLRSLGAGAAVAGLLLVVWRSSLEAPAAATPPVTPEALEDAATCQLVSPGPDGFSMRNLLLTWPPSKPRGLIYVTVNAASVDATVALVRNVYTNFNRRFDYPFVIFYDSPDTLKLLRENLARVGHDEASRLGQVFVYNVSQYWKMPGKVNVGSLKVKARLSQMHHPVGCLAPGNAGYMLMCRFQSKGITEIPFVRGFEYLWRLDADSSLCEELQLDLFVHMKENDYWQGYLVENAWDGCAQYLTEAVHSYVDRYNVIPAQGIDSIKEARAQSIYSNFEILKVQFFQSKEYRHYINFIDNGFFENQWCDGPVKTQAYRLFMPKTKMRQFKVGEVFYQHQSFNRCRKL